MAFGLLRPRGRLLIVPETERSDAEPLTVDLAPALAAELSIQTVSDASMREGLARLADGSILTDGLCEGPARFDAFAASIV